MSANLTAESNKRLKKGLRVQSLLLSIEIPLVADRAGGRAEGAVFKIDYIEILRADFRFKGVERVVEERKPLAEVDKGIAQPAGLRRDVRHRVE